MGCVCIRGPWRCERALRGANCPPVAQVQSQDDIGVLYILHKFRVRVGVFASVLVVA